MEMVATLIAHRILVWAIPLALLFLWATRITHPVKYLKASTPPASKLISWMGAWLPPVTGMRIMDIALNVTPTMKVTVIASTPAESLGEVYIDGFCQAT